jgi:CheY-like chemotaxis protein
MNLTFNNLKAKSLVVYDTPSAINWLVNVLQKNNYEVLIAKNGCLALEIARTKLPDLILLDIILPDLSGYNICLHLKAFPQTSKIPIIFTSGLKEGLDLRIAEERYHSIVENAIVGIYQSTPDGRYISAILKDQFEFEERGKMAIKGEGEMTTYWLLGKARQHETSHEPC